MIKCNAVITNGKPSIDEIFVKIKAAGICHTDYDSLNWGKQIILGHEGTGTIEKIGRNVRGFIEGDSVILN